MANIYIRLPISRCQYYRNRDARHPLMPHEPIKFSEYAEEHYVIKHSLYNKAKANTIDDRIFTHQEWRNMMCGKDPRGGVVKLARDKDEWLTYKEVIQILGQKQNDKTDQFDYLCIKLPTEVYCIDDVRPVTPTWSMDSYGYNRLCELINNDFKRSLVDWSLATFDYCTSGGRIILRAQAAMLERYLMRYGIEPSQTEKDSLRRVIDRWFRQVHCNYSSYSTFDIEYKDASERVAKVDAVEWL